MQLQTDLSHQLRCLKLSGILDTLEVRMLECQKNELDYQTFLSLYDIINCKTLTPPKVGN